MHELVLEPLGMSGSTYEQPLPAALEPLAATGHDQRGEPIPGKWHTHPERAAAGLWTTPSDLARWIIGVQLASDGESALLSGSMTNAMLTAGMGGWGLGPTVTGAGHEARFGHGGSNVGFRAQATGFARRGQGAVIMTNGNNGGALAQEILAAIARVYEW
jgi:CubicO group peptidase (beta-lactamase class C family)